MGQVTHPQIVNDAEAKAKEYCDQLVTLRKEKTNTKKWGIRSGHDGLALITRVTTRLVTLRKQLIEARNEMKNTQAASQATLLQKKKDHEKTLRKVLSAFQARFPDALGIWLHETGILAGHPDDTAEPFQGTQKNIRLIVMTDRTFDPQPGHLYRASAKQG